MISIDDQIVETQLTIQGGEEWLRRAMVKEIKRSPEQIERRPTYAAACWRNS